MCHWKKETLRFFGRGRHVLLAWRVRLSPAPNIAIVSTWKMMRGKARRTSIAQWCGMAVIGRRAVKAPVKGAETALEPAAGDYTGFVEQLDSTTCLTVVYIHLH